MAIRKAVFMCIILMLVLTFFPQQAAAADEKAVTFSYESEDKEEKRTVEESIEEDGRVYRLQGVTYEVEELEPETETRTIIKEDPAALTHDPAPETIEEDGLSYTLVRVESEDQVISGRKLEVQDEQEIVGTEIPQIMETVVTDPESKEQVRYELPLVSQEEIRKDWQPWTFTVTIMDPSAVFYRMNGHLIPMGTVPGEEDYPAILARMNADPELFRITGLTWGEVVNGRQQINGTGQQAVPVYRAVYKDTVNLPDLTVTVQKAIYEAIVPKEQPPRFKITATAMYVYESFWKTTPGRIVIGAGILILAVGSVAILMILAKKRKLEGKKK